MLNIPFHEILEKHKTQDPFELNLLVHFDTVVDDFCVRSLEGCHEEQIQQLRKEVLPKSIKN